MLLSSTPLALPAAVSGQRRFRFHLSKKNIGNTMDAYINAYTSIPIPRINVPMICTHIRDTLFSNPVPFVPRLKMSLRVFNPLVAKKKHHMLMLKERIGRTI
jgi:hypothetical protein